MLLQAGCPSCHPTNNIKAVKDVPQYDNCLQYQELMVRMTMTLVPWLHHVRLPSLMDHRHLLPRRRRHRHLHHCRCCGRITTTTTIINVISVLTGCSNSTANMLSNIGWPQSRRKNSPSFPGFSRAINSLLHRLSQQKVNVIMTIIKGHDDPV